MPASPAPAVVPLFAADPILDILARSKKALASHTGISHAHWYGLRRDLDRAEGLRRAELAECELMAPPAAVRIAPYMLDDGKSCTCGGPECSGRSACPEPAPCPECEAEAAGRRLDLVASDDPAPISVSTLGIGRES